MLGAYPLAVGRFENYSTTSDRILSYNGIAKKAGTWYVPFAPAPVLGFAWDTTEDANYPSVRFGWAGSPERSGTVPTWAKDLNWYKWNLLRTSSEFNTAQTDCMTYTRTLVMDKGLTILSGGYNSTARLSAVRNLAPSACVGRPLLLANEPNYSDQGNMTHAEMARQVLVYRSWPGDLHSQAYGKEPFYNCSPCQGGYDIGISHGVASVLTGKTEPGKTDYATFKTYWNNEVGNVFGNLSYDSLAVHFYMFRDDIIDGSGINSARLNEMTEWKTEAQGEGYKVQVTEYGVIPTISFQACDEACVAARIDEIHDGIITSLSGVYWQLMWYSFSDADITSDIDWERVSAFYDNGGTWQLKSPVGTTWEADADHR